MAAAAWPACAQHVTGSYELVFDCQGEGRCARLTFLPSADGRSFASLQQTDVALYDGAALRRGILAQDWEQGLSQDARARTRGLARETAVLSSALAALDERLKASQDSERAAPQSARDFTLRRLGELAGSCAELNREAGRDILRCMAAPTRAASIGGLAPILGAGSRSEDPGDPGAAGLAGIRAGGFDEASLRQAYDNSRTASDAVASPTGAAGAPDGRSLALTNSAPRRFTDLGLSVPAISAGAPPRPQDSLTARMTLGTWAGLRTSPLLAAANLPLLPKAVTAQAAQAAFGIQNAERARQRAETTRGLLQDLLDQASPQDRGALEVRLQQHEAIQSNTGLTEAQKLDRLRQWQDETDRSLRTDSAGYRREEDRLALSLASARASEDPGATRQAQADMQTFLDGHPPLAAYYQRTQEYREFITQSALAGKIPNGTRLSPESLGMDLPRGATLTISRQPSASGARQGYLIAGLGGNLQSRFISFDGKVQEDNLTDPNGNEMTIRRTTDAQGAVAQRVWIRDPRTEIHSEGIIDAQGRLSIQRSTWRDTEHRPMFDANGTLAAIELSRDRTGNLDMESLSRLKDANGRAYLSEKQVAQLRTILTPESLRNRQYTTPPRLILTPDGPQLIYQPQKPAGTATTTVNVSFTAEGALRHHSHHQWPNGTSSDDITLLRGYDARAGRMTQRENYRTHFYRDYNAVDDFHVAQGVRHSRSVWDPKANNGRGGYAQTEESAPKNAGVFSVISRNMSWTFENVAGYKHAAAALGFAADRGLDLGRGFSAGIAQGAGAVTGSVDHQVYAIATGYQMPILANRPGAALAVMGEMRETLSAQDYQAFRARWTERYKDNLRTQARQRGDVAAMARLDHARFSASDEDLGQFIVQGGVEGLAGMQKEGGALGVAGTVVDSLGPTAAFMGMGAGMGKLGQFAAGHSVAAGALRAVSAGQQVAGQTMMGQMAANAGAACTEGAAACVASLAQFVNLPGARGRGARPNAAGAAADNIRPSTLSRDGVQRAFEAGGDKNIDAWVDPGTGRVLSIGDAPTEGAAVKIQLSAYRSGNQVVIMNPAGEALNGSGLSSDAQTSLKSALRGYNDAALVDMRVDNLARQENLPPARVEEAREIGRALLESGLPSKPRMFNNDFIEYKPDGIVTPLQGIKLRVGDPGNPADRQAVLKEFLEIVGRDPELARHLQFKVAMDVEGMSGTQAGKFITIYTENPAAARALGERFDAALSEKGLTAKLPPEDFPFGGSGVLSWRYGCQSGKCRSLLGRDGKYHPDNRADPVANLNNAPDDPGMDFWRAQAAQTRGGGTGTQPKTDPAPRGAAAVSPAGRGAAQAFVSRIQAGRAAGRIRRGDDVINALEEGVRRGEVVEGTFYRVLSREELATWGRGIEGLGLMPNGTPAPYRWAGPRDIVSGQYGAEGLVLVEFEGVGVRYGPGAREHEVGVIKVNGRPRIVQDRLQAPPADGVHEVSDPGLTPEDFAAMGVEIIQPRGTPARKPGSRRP